MSAWRRLAIETFPEQQRQFEDRRATIYHVFFDLLSLAREYHGAENEEELGRIYGYAEWCWQQRKRAPDIFNAAAVAFYEHLADSRSTFKAIPHRITPAIFADIKVLLAARMSEDDYQALLADYNRVNGTKFTIG